MNRQSSPRYGTRTPVAAERARVPLHWFLTGPATPEDLTAKDPRIADLMLHAKSMGTSRSACGLDTTTWTKLWDTPFEAAPVARRCPICLTRVRDHGLHLAPGV